MHVDCSIDIDESEMAEAIKDAIMQDSGSMQEIVEGVANEISASDIAAEISTDDIVDAVVDRIDMDELARALLRAMAAKGGA
jgi:tRNA threonylcarbamoyladenosine modification (KEOPS) complex  Pcc1 subunit